MPSGTYIFTAKVLLDLPFWFFSIVIILFFQCHLCTQSDNCADLHTREHALMKTVLVINLEVKDNHEEAAVGARLALELCQEVCYYKLYSIVINCLFT